MYIICIYIYDYIYIIKGSIITMNPIEEPSPRLVTAVLRIFWLSASISGHRGGVTRHVSDFRVDVQRGCEGFVP